jgi:transcription antitermination factor NusG
MSIKFFKIIYKMGEINLLKWHVLYVANRCEKIVAAQLNDRGIETCLPASKEIRKWSDRNKLVERMLFPNYVFLGIDIRLRHTLNGLRHVVGFVKFGREVAILNDGDVNLIKNIGKISHNVLICKEKIGTGDEVEIIDGPLKNLKGFVISNDGSALIQIEIPSLKCFAKVSLEKGKLKRI